MIKAFCSIKISLPTFILFPIFAFAISNNYESVYRSGWSKTKWNH